MNKVILHGRLAKDPDYRYTQNGTAVASFTVAVDRPKGKDGNQTADFIPCVAWSGLADVINNYFTKGKEILLEGRMQVRSYEAQDGSKRYVTEVVLNDLDFCGSKTSGGGGAPAGGNQNDFGGFGGSPASDDDIPF